MEIDTEDIIAYIAKVTGVNPIIIASVFDAQEMYETKRWANVKLTPPLSKEEWDTMMAKDGKE